MTSFTNLYYKLQIHVQDNYPKQICGLCFHNLKIFCHFKEKCESSIKMFIELIGPAKIDASNINENEPQKMFKDCSIQTDDIMFYFCEVCPSKFLSYGDLEVHRKTMHNQKAGKYNCRECGKEYDRLQKLQVHIANIHPEISNIKSPKDNICPYCKKNYSTRNRLEIHLGKSHKEMPIFIDENEIKNEFVDHNINTCTEIDVLEETKAKVEIEESILEVESANLVDVYIKEEHHTDRENSIEAAPNDNIEIHKTKEENITEDVFDKFHCNDMNESSSNSDVSFKLPTNSQILYDSIKEENDPESKQPKKSPIKKVRIKRRFNDRKKKYDTTNKHVIFECHHCGNKYDRKNYLIRHMHTHSGIKPHKCSYCHKAYTRPETLRYHIASRHKEYASNFEFNIFCNICQKGFHRSSYLETHMKTHEDKEYNCAVCNEVFTSRELLKEHCKSHQEALLCTECGQMFTRTEYLNAHMRRHTGEKPYSCRFCDKSFMSSTQLKVHERYHTGEKPHVCSICSKGFGRPYNLKVHMRSHTGERPYKCPHCDKRFAQNCDLKQHVRRHTGEREKCDICGKTFLLGFMLTKHKRIEHGLDVKSHNARLEKFLNIDISQFPSRNNIRTYKKKSDGSNVNTK